MSFPIANVTGKIKTAKALLCVRKDGSEFWVPLSQIEAGSEVSDKGQTGTIIITDFIAEARGLNRTA